MNWRAGKWDNRLTPEWVHVSCRKGSGILMEPVYAHDVKRRVCRESQNAKRVRLRQRL